MSLKARGYSQILSILMFILGACGLAYEYTVSKIASDLIGNSVQQWAMMIATMLFAMGMGADIQKRIPQRILADTVIFSQNVLALVGGCAPLLLIYCFSQAPEIYSVVQYGIALLLGTLIGFEIPIVMRLNEEASGEMKFNLAQVLKMDYIGALIGALLWTFVLVRVFGIEQISFILGMTTLVASGLCFWLYRDQVKRVRWRLAETGVVLVVLVLGLLNSDRLVIHAEQFLYKDEVVFSQTTAYQHIVLTKSSQGKLRCYINGHLQFDENDEYIYHEQLVHPVMQLCDQPRNILILGGGDGLAAREVLKYPSVEKITLVDIDPVMTDLASTHPDFIAMSEGSLLSSKVWKQFRSAVTPGEPDERVQVWQSSQRDPLGKTRYSVAEVDIINVDAGSFVMKNETLYDVVIIDFPDPSSPDLAKLYSKLFYHSLKQCLTPRGLIVQQSGSPYHAKEAFLCVGRTMEASGYQVLPYHDNVPSFGEWGWWIASPYRALNSEVVKEQLLSAEGLPETRYVTPEVMSTAFVFGKDQLATDQEAVTSLTQSSIYHYYLEGWQDK